MSQFCLLTAQQDFTSFYSWGVFEWLYFEIETNDNI